MGGGGGGDFTIKQFGLLLFRTNFTIKQFGLFLFRTTSTSSTTSTTSNISITTTVASKSFFVRLFLTLQSILPEL